MAYQNFFAAKLYADIGSSDTTIILDTAPTALSGRMVLEARNPTQREIIKYTGVSGNQLTGVTRGVGGTSAKAHLKNALIEQNLTAEDIQDLYDGFASFSASANDWRTLAVACTGVTYNGNGSYDLTFASTVAALLSSGMRLRTARTVAAPTFMGGLFNGTTQYFTKVTPTATLSTVTDNVTFKATIEPTIYQPGGIIGRSDSSPANGIWVEMNPTGQITVAVRNGAVGNTRTVTSYQSVPLNKKTKIWVTWAAGVVTMRFNGVSVPVQPAVTTGTAPTAAGLGGDFSIGRVGAYTGGSFFAGYISDGAVFNAVLTPTVMNSYDSQVLSGSETNCIGAWSLNNTGVNQQAPGTNDLAAGGSAGYTNRSPYGTQADGSVSSTLDYAVITKVNGVTVTVQVPESCTIPTSGGVSAVSYSGVKAPYGMPVSKEKFRISTIYKASETVLIGAVAFWTISNFKITCPVGKFNLGWQAPLQLSSTVAGVRDGNFTLANSPTNAVYNTPLTVKSYLPGSNAAALFNPSVENTIDLSAQTAYSLYGSIVSASGSESYIILGANGQAILYADLAEL